MEMFPNKQSTEKYCKEPEVGSLVKEFYQACRTVAEDRYDQLLGQIHHSQPQLNFPAKMGPLCTDSLPESPVCFNSQNLVKRKLFLSPRAPTRSRKQVYECQQTPAGGKYSPFSSISESDSDSKSLKKQVDGESKSLREKNEQLSRDLNNSRSEQKALQKHLDKLQDELKALQQHNSLLHLEASSVQSEKSAMVDEVERLMKANLALADNVAFGARQTKNLEEELYICQQEKGKLLSALKEIGEREENFKDKLKAKFQQLTQELMPYASWEDLQDEGMVLHELESKLHSEAFHDLPHDTRESNEKVSGLHLENFESKEDKNSDEKLKLMEERSPDLQHVDHVFTSQDERCPKLSEALLKVSETVQCLKQKLRHAQEALESSDGQRCKMGKLVGEMKRSISVSQCNAQRRHNERAKVKQLLEAYSRAVFATLLQGEKAIEVRELYDKMHLKVQQKILTQMEHEAHEEQAFELGGKGIVLGRLDGEIHTNSSRVELLAKQGSEVLPINTQLENNCIELQTFQSDVHKLQASLWESKDQNNSLKEQMNKLMQVFEESGREMNQSRDDQNDKHTTVKGQVREAQITSELAVDIWNDNCTKQDERKIIKEQLEASINEIQRSVELQTLVECIQIENRAFKSVLKRSLQTFCRQNEFNHQHQATYPSDRNTQNLDKDLDGVMWEIFGSAKPRDLYLAEIASLRKESREILRQFELRESHFFSIQLDAEKLSKSFSDSQQKNAFLIEQCEKLNKDKQDLEVKLAILQERTSKSDAELVISGIEGAGQELIFNLEEHEDGGVEFQKVDTKLTIDSETEKAHQPLTAHEATALLQKQGSSKFQEADDALADQERKLELYVDKLQEENESLGKRSKDLASIKGQHDLQEKEALQTEIRDLTLQVSCINKTSKERFTELQLENSQLKPAKSLLESEHYSSTKKMKSSEESWRLERDRLKDNIKRPTEEKKELQSNELEFIKPVALDGAEVLQDNILAFEQNEVDAVQWTVENLKDLEDGLKNLKEHLNRTLKLNSLLDGQLSTMAFHSENVVLLAHAEALMLLEKISKLSELTHTSGEKVKVIVDTFHRLQVSSLVMTDELSASVRKEKALKITLRFMRAEFLCLGQRIKVLKEEKETQARQAELAMKAERKKNEEAISKLCQEMDYQEEQNRRQSELIIERGEEKREAIRQLSFALNYMQEDNRYLEGVIKSKCKIYRRQSAFGADAN